MKYKMMADEGFTDKLDETIKYVPGDMIKTEVDEERKENLVARKLAHVVEENDTTDDKAKKKAEEEAAKKLAEEEAKKKAKEKGAKNKASKTPTNEK